MKIQIKNRYTGQVLLEGEVENVRELIEKNKEVSLRGDNIDN